MAHVYPFHVIPSAVRDDVEIVTTEGNKMRHEVCPCNSQKSYVRCCEPYLTGKQFPDTPEALMRSRYTAYTMANIDYIKATMRGKALIGFQTMDATRWAKRVHWIKLQVFHSHIEHEHTGYVEFEAHFVDDSRLQSIHENSEFIREEGRWYYVDGTPLAPSQAEETISRNAHCPCGSQRKFKHCHGAG